MSQLLIVQGDDASTVERWFERGLASFRSIHGVDAFDTIEEPRRSVAVFGRRKGCVGILRDPAGPDTPKWVCGAGAWFYDGAPGEQGLKRLACRAPSDKPEISLKGIDGPFVIAYSGSEPGELVLITDRLGSLHVYEGRVESTLLLSTSSLVLAALLSPEWDPVGLRQFIGTGTIFDRHTFYTGIEKLPPSTVFRYRWTETRPPQTYWSVAASSYDRAPSRGGVEAVAAGLRQAMATIAASYPNAVLDVTGGYDSRGLVGAMLQENLRFHTVVSGSETNRDAIVAQRIAQEFGLTHDRREPGPKEPQALWARAKQALEFTDGEYDVLLYATVLETHSTLSERFGASINGSNGEILKGQWWEILLPRIGGTDFDANRVAAARFAYGDPTELLAFDFKESLVGNVAEIIRKATAGMEGYPNTALLDCAYLRLRMQRWQGRLMSATNRIWPVLSPYTFREPMEMALATPVHDRVRHRLSRRLIEHQNPKLASLPLAQGYPALPVRWNTLHRFWPLATESLSVGWTAGLRLVGLRRRSQSVYNYALRKIAHLEEVREILTPSKMRTADLYREEFLRDLSKGTLWGGVATAEQTGRVLTVEMAARAVAKARQE